MSNPNADRDDANTDAATEAAADTMGTPGAAPAYEGADARAQDLHRIEVGWSVFGSDGEEIGKVAHVGPGWFSVPYGRENEHRMYVPSNYIETVTNRRVVLSQPAGLLIDMKLDQPPGDFPEEHERVGGVEHQPWRNEPGDLQTYAEPAGMPAQALAPRLERSSDEAGAVERHAPVQELPTPPPAGEATIPTGGGTAPGESATARVRTRVDDAALQPAEPWVDQSGGVRGGVEATISGEQIAAAEVPGEVPPERVATRMTPSQASGTALAGERTAQLDRHPVMTDERPGASALTLNESYDEPGGPTVQPGVRAGPEHQPLRTPFGETGTPGESQERNVTDLDLARNRHPGRGQFSPQESTVGRPIRPGEPSIARRSVPGLQGGHESPAVGDVPPGSVTRPAPKASQ